jgi:hypothetical protein
MRCQHTWTTTSNAGSMPNGACSSVAVTLRTPTRRDSRGPSTWSRSGRSTTRPPAVDAAAAPSRLGADRPTSEAVAAALQTATPPALQPRSRVRGTPGVLHAGDGSTA